MSVFQEIAPEDFVVSPFKLIGKDWMLIAAEKEGRVNAMTASWGGLGVMWGKNVAFAVIRPQRFTKEFVDASGHFSLNFFPPEHHSKLEYFGAVSGRDEDKVAKTGLHVHDEQAAPYFSEADKVLVCRKLFAQPYQSENFIDTKSNTTHYPNKDYHTLYIGEVVRILGRA
ncbi:MAG: flavin reductase family protein [Planctomycetaceae bacterium]|nr:flavin reductase family protein [Planctomycetaceae bacterium]